ncbi:unnamed protein product [Lymnaea stagnalis]|uniref:Uncharacterized protein n=1 Tax=Lymnaea stagnalis TaxID=6523 RepID=A0AAV2HP76_LYMST
MKLVQLVVWLTFVVYCTCESDHSTISTHLKTDGKCYKQETCEDSNVVMEEQQSTHKGESKLSTSLAVVIYDETKVLPHEMPTRKFIIADHEFIINQNWQGLGVAAVVWDSAVVLAEYLDKHRNLVEHKRVLELGAGSGLTGLVAAALGAEVILTERASALDHLTAAIDANSLNKSWKISARVLDWTEDVDPRGFDELDLILGADIIYIEETFQDLLRTLKSLTPSNKILTLLSCKIRYDRDLRFLKMLEKEFDVNEIHEDSDKQIKVIAIRRKL